MSLKHPVHAWCLRWGSLGIPLSGQRIDNSPANRRITATGIQLSMNDFDRWIASDLAEKKKIPFWCKSAVSFERDENIRWYLEVGGMEKKIPKNRINGGCLFYVWGDENKCKRELLSHLVGRISFRKQCKKRVSLR